MRPIDVYSGCLAEPVCDMRDHLDYLRHIACGNILEIGVRGGASTSAFLLGLEEHGGHLYSVDIEAYCGAKFAEHPQWTFIHADSHKIYYDLMARIASPAFLEGKPGFQFDILFIDGDHEYAGVRADLALAEYVKPGGKILMHDVCEPSLAGVRQAMDEFLAEKGWPLECKGEGWPQMVQIRTASHGLAVIEVPQ